MTHVPAALIVGASRGLGLGLAAEYLRRGWRVVGTVRGESQTGLHALAAASEGNLSIEPLDMTDRAAIAALRQRLAARNFDLLFVNAGIANGSRDSAANAETEQFVRIMLTNTLAPMHVIEALQDLVARDGTIGVMSSGLGSVSGNETGGREIYRASKAALNMLMRSYAARTASEPRSLRIIDPGWVRTDMGGPDADLDVATSTLGIVDTLVARAGQPGLLYLNYRGETVPW